MNKTKGQELKFKTKYLINDCLFCLDFKEVIIIWEVGDMYLM